MVYELADAIYDKAIAASALRVLVSDSTSGNLLNGVHFTVAPEDAKMPYIVYYVISHAPMHCFNSDSTVEDHLVQFSIFDNSSNTSTISSIRDQLLIAFDRQSLTYLTVSDVGCLREAEGGPFKTEDGWQWTLDFRILYTFS